jgi:hypothetical protein
VTTGRLFVFWFEGTGPCCRWDRTEILEHAHVDVQVHEEIPKLDGWMLGRQHQHATQKDSRANHAGERCCRSCSPPPC